MKGLIGQAQQPQQPQQPGPQQSPGQPPEQAQQPPQEQQRADSQEAYDVATGQMLNFVYDKDGIESLTRLIEATGDPEAGMSRLIGRLLTTTVQSAMMAGKRVAPEIIFQGAIEVARAVSEVAQSRGLLDPKQEKQITEAAFYDGLALFAQEAQDEALTEGERQRYIELIDMAEQMEQKAQGMTAEGPARQAGQQPPKQPPQQAGRQPEPQERRA